MNIPQVLFAIIVELFMITMAAIFLLKPKFIFGQSASTRSFALLWIGMFFLCVSFCWSVVLGAVLFINGIEVQI